MDVQDKVNILLVDDQPGKLLSYEAILGELNENLIKTNSAREALEFLLKNDVAVILIDVCMPELDGFELARMLRDHPRYEKTAIIFISAVQISEFDHLRGYETGAVDYVPVPVVPEILRAKVKIFAELWRKTRQLESMNEELERRVQERTSELEASTSQLLETVEHLGLASEAAGFGTYDYNVTTGHIYWSPYLRRMFGVAEDQPLSLDYGMSLIHSDHVDLVRQHISGYAPGAGRRELEFKIVRPDGQVRWFLDRGQAVPDARGPGVRVMGTTLDITERKRNEERQRLLMAELDHRVKNILANVLAVARLSSRRAQTVEGFVEALDGRIQAISRAHGLLRKSSWGGANLAELVSQSLSPFQTSRNIETAGEALTIVPQLAQTMALILHELATNAVKHGALSESTGRVRVTWSRPSPGQLQFIWQETGGPKPSAQPSNGFGLTMLRTAASDLGACANYDFTAEGFIYSLEGHFEQAQPTAVVIPFNRPGEDNAADQSAGRVLIVEDEGLIALQLQTDVQEAGFRVVGPARSLKQGLDLAAREQIDAALLDVSLGKDLSTQIAEELQSRGIPIAFVTGYADRVMLPDHLREVVTLNKPYAVRELRTLLEELMSVQAKRELPSWHEGR